MPRMRIFLDLNKSCFPYEGSSGFQRQQHEAHIDIHTFGMDVYGSRVYRGRRVDEPD